MFSDAAGTVPTLTANTVAGFAFTIDVNLDGTTTVTNYSAQTTIVNAVPAPAIDNGLPTALLCAGLLSLVAIERRFRG